MENKIKFATQEKQTKEIMKNMTKILRKDYEN